MDAIAAFKCQVCDAAFEGFALPSATRPFFTMFSPPEGPAYRPPPGFVNIQIVDRHGDIQEVACCSSCAVEALAQLLEPFATPIPLAFREGFKIEPRPVTSEAAKQAARQAATNFIFGSTPRIGSDSDEDA